MTPTDGLRPIIERVDRELTRVAARLGADASPLLASWTALVDHLALGPPPELLPCPFCGSVGMRAATRCGNCWKKLEPPTSPVSA